MKEINILGMKYRIEEVDCVNKFEPRKGEIDFMTNEIRIDKSLPIELPTLPISPGLAGQAPGLDLS